MIKRKNVPVPIGLVFYNIDWEVEVEMLTPPLGSVKHVPRPTFQGLLIKNNIRPLLKWLRCKGGFERSSKSTLEKCSKIIIYTFEKY